MHYLRNTFHYNAPPVLSEKTNIQAIVYLAVPKIIHASRLTPHASRLTPHASRLTPHASRLQLTPFTTASL